MNKMRFDFLTSAKVNMGLTVAGKLPNGYHEIESIFLPVGIFDKIFVEFSLDDASKSIEVLSDRGIQIPNDERNIVWKVVKYVEENINKNIGFFIRIEKNIPVGSGLGGGSGNGAGVFLALMKFLKYFNVIDDKSERELVDGIYEIGSDIPFFLNKGACVVRGRGEKVYPLEGVVDKLKEYTVLVVYPNVEVSTAKAYKLVSLNNLFDDNNWAFNFYRDFMENRINLSNFKEMLKNTFEFVILNPVIEKVKEYLYSEGAMFALMSGSGSAVYGIFEDLELTEVVKGLVSKFNISKEFIFITKFVLEQIVFF